MLDGVLFFKVAEPPDNSKLKSSRSRSPVPLADEKTGTLKRTFTFLLSEFNLDSVIVGALKSNKFTEVIELERKVTPNDEKKVDHIFVKRRKTKPIAHASVDVSPSEP